MKKYIYFIALVLVFSSCSKIDELTKFNIDYTTQVTIPATTGIELPFSILTPDVETNSESSFDSNNTHKNLIEEIKLTELQLVITSPDNSNFDFLESIEVYISAEDLEEVKIASKTTIPESVSTLDLEVSDIDLKDYIKKDSYSLRLNTITDQKIDSDHEIDVNTTFFVDAKILGL